MKKKQVLIALFVILIIRLSLPFFIEYYIESSINETEDFRCTIHDVDLQIYRGGFSIDSFTIYQTNNDVNDPFFSVVEIRSSLEWNSLFKGHIVGETTLYKPVVNFLDDQDEDKQQVGGVSWVVKAQELAPLELNSFQIKDGRVRFQNKSSNPPVDLSVSDIDLRLTNLKNVKDTSSDLPSGANIQARIFRTGKLVINGRLDVLREIPNVDADVKIDDVNLMEMNDFAEAYGDFDFERGAFAGRMEYAMANKKVTGYIKPFFTNVKVLNLKGEDKKSFLGTLWEGVVGAAFEITENQPRDQTATRIKFDGKYDDVNANVWTTVWNILRNAFVKAFEMEIDNSIEFSDAKEMKNKDSKK